MKKRKKNKEDYFSKFTQYIQSKDELKLQEKEYYLEKYTIFQNVMEIMPCAMYLLDYRQQRHIFISDEIQDLIGYTSEDFIRLGYDWYLDQLHFEDMREFTERVFENFVSYAQKLDKEQIKNAQFSINYRFKNKKGHFLQLLDQFIVLEVDDENNPVLVLGILSDISAHKTDNKIIFSINEYDANRTNKSNVTKAFPKKVAFTKRQKEIIALIKTGKSSKEIAAHLKLSIHTVHAHRRKLLERHNCKNTSELLHLYHLDVEE